ncbi:MAG: precorrin-6A reductase [Candidatus Methanomethylophilaceae archaeon]|nr:precorrin-6A reductase [Candidatus Methanomethylophilaceae archaeon]
MTRVLIFSGTTEGRNLAEDLASRGVDITVSVATDYGAVVMEPRENLKVRVGSCGGAEGIAELIAREGFGIVVDATHPYATRITAHIREGCAAAGCEYIRLLRGRSSSSEDGDVIVVGTVEEAVDYLKDKEGRILAATGVKEIDLFTRIPDYRERVVARVLSTLPSMQRCDELGFSGANLICAQGPFSEEMNYATLLQTGAKWLVTKDSGTAGGFEEKHRAARRAGAKVVMVARPPDDGKGYEEVLGMLEDRLSLEHGAPSGGAFEKGTFTLVGIGIGRDSMTLRAARAVASADLLIGAKRMLEAVDVAGRDTLTEYRSKEITEYLSAHPGYRNVVYLLSGDVGFFSGATKMLKDVDQDRFDVRVECGISSSVYLCSKLGIPWQDVRLISAHGRYANVVGAVRTSERLFTLLTGESSVHSICKDLIDYGLGGVTVTIAEDMGYETERIVSGTPEEMLGMGFSDLCVGLIENPGYDPRNPISIPDEEFVRGDAPMTKSEVRALSVAKLKLSHDSVIYDVGAGTGSVSIEMALCSPDGMVYAVEKEDAAAELIDVNRHKFATPNVEIIKGLAPEAMEGLPAPTHAFIGGSSGNLLEIVKSLVAKNPDIRMVINSVTIETMAETMEVIRALGLVEEETVCVNVSKARKAGRYHLMTAQNPVYISVVRGR